MSIHRHFIPVLVLVTLFSAYGIAELTGYWSVSGKTSETSLTSAEDIKGWMTLQNVSDRLAIPPAELLSLLGLPPETPLTTAFKDLEETIEVTEARELIAVYLAGDGLPPVEAPLAPAGTQAPESTPTPEATPIPIEDVPTGGSEPSSDGSGPTPLPAGVYLLAADIKGRTTLQEIVTNDGIPLETLLTALGLPVNTDPATNLKDLVGQGNITTVEDVKAIIAELQK